MKHTQGKWEVTQMLNVVSSESGKMICATQSNIDGHEIEANAKLIAEAGTVASETGKTPRQLADENKMLLEALDNLVKDIKADNYNYRLGTMNAVERAIKAATIK